MSSEQTNDKTAHEQLIELVDSINWERPPYRGAMTELAERRDVSPQAISNAVRRDRSEEVIIELLGIVKRREQKALAAMRGVRGNVDALLGGVR